MTIDDLTVEDTQAFSDSGEDEPTHEAVNGDNDDEHDESNDEELDDQWEVTQQVPDPSDEPRLFHLDGPSALNAPSDLPNIIRDEEDTITNNPTAELLKSHHDFGHPSFKKLQEMAKLGVLPHRLAKCNVPVCSACQYAKATRRP